MDSITFSIEHNRLEFGGFPIHSLNKIHGVTVKITPNFFGLFKDKVTINVNSNESNMFATVFVLGGFANMLIERNKEIKN